MNRALGKLPARRDPRTLRLARYLDPRNYPAPPPARDWIDHAHAFDALGNTTVGDCAFAAQAHLIQCQAAANGKTVSISKDDALGAYARVTGWHPTVPGSDRGTQLLDALADWRKIGLAGHTIGAFVQVDVTNQLELEAAINLFGGLYAGVQLPIAAKTQTLWDIAPAGKFTDDYVIGSWGGHCLAISAYSRTGLVGVTWGQLKHLTWEWLYSYADEVYAVISPDWVTDAAAAPNGIDITSLLRDLTALAAAPNRGP